MDHSSTGTQIHNSDRHLPRIGALLIIGSLVYALGIPVTAMAKPEKVTLCHAAGQDGTEQFVTLNLSYPAVYGNSGHLNEDGTSQAGHEGDYLGECIVEPVTTTTVLVSTTSTVPVSTTTTVPVSTTSTVPVSTTTTVPVSTTTTVPADEDEEGVAAAAVENQDDFDQVDAATDEPPTTPSNPQVGAAETLPYTGVDVSLLVPATLMLIAGAVLVIATGGLSEMASGAHVSVGNRRFGLGLHRGRHESRNLNRS
jgi:hypothetical protein